MNLNISKHTNFPFKSNLEGTLSHFLYFLIISSLVLPGCAKKEDPNNIVVNYTNRSKLILIDSLEFKNNDSTYIGAIRTVKVTDNNIFISDRSFMKIHIFNKRLKYLKSVGRYGNGPGEFVEAPDLSIQGDTLIAFEPIDKRLYYYDSNLKLVKVIKLPNNFVYMKTAPLYINNKIAIAATNKQIRDLNDNIKDYTTVLYLDNSGKVYKNFGNLDKTYKENKDKFYYARNNYAIISKGFNNSVAAIQLATSKIILYDMLGKVINKLEYRPRFYKNPPEINTNYQFRSMEEAMQIYYSKKTHFAHLFYDEKTDILSANYRTLKEDQYKSRSFLDADNYIWMINKDKTCVIDEKIPGYVADINDGLVYVVTEESDQLLKIMIYKINGN